MQDKWGRVTPAVVEASKRTSGKVLKTHSARGYSTRPFPDDPPGTDYGYVFYITVGKTDLTIQFTRSQVEEMLSEMWDREVEDMDDPLADEAEDGFDWDKAFADIFGTSKPEKPVEEKPIMREVADLENILAALMYEPTPDQSKARDLLDSWGWLDIDYHRDGHLIRASDGTMTYVWHAEAIVAQQQAKADDKFRSALDCPTHGDTTAETLAEAGL